MLDRFEWQELSEQDARLAAAHLLAGAGHALADDIKIRGHVARLPFYTRVQLMHLAIERAGQPPATLLLLTDGARAIPLTGSSAPIHAINAAEKLALDEETVASYLRFFCFVVRGDAGPFLIVEPPVSPPPAAVPAMPETPPPVAAQARELEARGRDEQGRFIFHAIVGYGGSLFRSVFAVAPDGSTEMLDDEVIGDDDAPVELPAWPPLLEPSQLAPDSTAVTSAPASSPRKRVPIGRTVLRSMVELLLEHALEVQSGHRLIAHFNQTRSDADAIGQFADLLASTSPIVIIRSSIPFVEETIADILEERLPRERRIPKVRADVDGGDDTRLRPIVPSKGPGLVLFSFHSYRSVVDVERVSHELTSRDVAALIGCENVHDVPEPLRRVADLSLALPPLTSPVFQTLFARVIGEPLPTDWSAGGTHWVGNVLHTDLEQPQGLGLSARDALAFIRERVQERMRAVDPAGGLGLADLHGLGEAREFAIDLIADIHAAIAGRIAWTDVDRGVLLVGPPGTGKTTLARAIARDCGIKFISSSAAGWQAAGHLGDHIRAMRSDFAQARRNAPAILFVDEIDSIGSREAFTGPNAQYHTEVVNALLEQMQGLDVSAPVIVLAATNHGERIDPALRRAGRLDRTIEIPYPNVEALTRMVEYYLGRYRGDGQVDNDIDMRQIGGLLFGLTGADVERTVRGGARRARKAGRPITQRDLVEEVLGMPRSRDTSGRLVGEEVVRVAVHEAGHALAACLSSTGGREVSYASIVPRADGSLGFVASVPTGRRVVTRVEMIERIEVILAGRAAEEILFGEAGISAGAGGASASSDLAAASSAALQLVAQTGFSPDGSLFWSREPGARHIGHAEQVLQHAYIAVKNRLAAHRDALGRIADALREKQELTGDELRALVGQTATVELTGEAGTGGGR
jgi:hypothetical protein